MTGNTESSSDSDTSTNTATATPQRRAPANVISDPSELTSFVDSLIFRIDCKYYDLTTFCDEHPGGKDILIWAKRKAWDHTQMFSIHHVNYMKAASMMNRYLIKTEKVIEKIHKLEAIEIPQRFPKQLPSPSSIYYPVELKGSGITAKYDYPEYSNDDKTGYKSDYKPSDLMMADCVFELPQKGSFYWELREEVYKYFKRHDIDYYPTPFYMNMWWIVVFLCISSQIAQYWFHSKLLAVFTGFTYLFLGGYGHQFIHNPVHFRNHAYICLDWIGLYSYTYMVDHIAVHHIFTNTLPDNHFDGTDPFCIVNPLIPREKWRKFLKVLVAFMTTACGIWGNYFYNVVLIVTKQEPFYWNIFIFPANYILMCCIVGSISEGLLLSTIHTVICSVWYFTIALMNHNQEENWDMKRLTAAAKTNKENGGWAEMQLVTSSDIGYNYGFIGSMLCLWLNYHTVHHLLPTVDMSHHREAQKILNRVSAKHGITYHYKPAWDMYWNMVDTFSIARAVDVMCEKQ